DGRPRPNLAKAWKLADDGRSVAFELRPNARFHDRSPVTASVVVQAFHNGLRRIPGDVARDIAALSAMPDDQHVKITFQRPATFLFEVLDAQIAKPGSPDVGTGAFMITGSDTPNELHANADYYLGRPGIDKIDIKAYPSVRAAWADMLRNNLD